MKEMFNNKTICFLGDSILAHGYYTYAMRSFIRKQSDKCIIYNRGIGGNRVDMTECLLDDEVFALNPDYCVFSFGANDLGIWLYDSFLEVTDQVLSQREARFNAYKNGVKNTVKLLREKGVEPIIMTPYAINQLLIEKPDIPTLGDNKEKASLIGPWFYKRKTFENINVALKGYCEWLEEFAKENGVLFFNIFDKLYDYMLTVDGMFADDGVHYTEKGSNYIAKCILEELGYKDVPSEFSKDSLNDEIFKVEQEERALCFVRFNEHNKILGDFTEEEIKSKAEKILSDPKTPGWMRGSYENYLKYYGKFSQLTKKVEKLTKEYLL